MRMGIRIEKRITVKMKMKIKVKVKINMRANGIKDRQQDGT